ncbi:MAG TPA: hypothetical protein VES21_09270 [Nocardioidaceae bacterium]|nr:hypothetical protein [Nocardioidaceae bacterium]
MNRRIAAVLTVPGLAIAGPVAMAAPAQADTPNCVTRTEYRSVQHGWSKRKVASVFDVAGRRVTVNDPYQAKVYNDCWRPKRPWGKVSVFYKYRNGAWRVIDKTTEFWHP